MNNLIKSIDFDAHFQMTATCFFGFESVLAQELLQLGAQKIELGNRMVQFWGDKGFLYKANFSLATAIKILIPIHAFNIYSAQDIYRNIKKIKWDDYLNVDQTFAIDSVVKSEYFTNSMYAGQLCKDALVDYFVEQSGKRPDVDKIEPDVPIHLYIYNQQVIVSLNSSGYSLHKRGYKLQQTLAPINEVLAAGILKIMGWDGKNNLLDPMCGSGTFLIEAAIMANQIPVQFMRKQFAFENWIHHNPLLFEQIKESRLKRITEMTGTIFGSDIDADSVAIAKENITHANLDEFICLKNADFFDTKKTVSPLMMVINPPYNERLILDTKDFYAKIGTHLKHHYSNTQSYIITADIPASKHFGLRSSQKIKLYNGALESLLLKFELFEGKLKGLNK